MGEQLALLLTTTNTIAAQNNAISAQLASLQLQSDINVGEIETLKANNLQLSQLLQAGRTASTSSSLDSPLRSPPSKKNRKENPRDDLPVVDMVSTYQSTLAVLFAKVVMDPNCPDDEDVYAPSTLSAGGNQLLASINKSSSFSAIWTKLHNAAKSKPATGGPLAPLASKLFLTNISLVRKILMGEMVHAATGNLLSMDAWRHEWTLAHFATPFMCDDFKTFKVQVTAEADSDILYSADSIHAVKKDSTLFFQGHFDSSVDTILGCVANFIVFTSTLIDMPHPWILHDRNPLIVNQLLELSGYMLDTDTKARINNASKHYPQLLFAIFSELQDLVSAMGHIIVVDNLPSTIYNNILTNKTFYFQTGSFDSYVNQFNTTKTGLVSLLKNLNPPPASPAFFVVHPVAKPAVISPVHNEPTDTDLPTSLSVVTHNKRKKNNNNNNNNNHNSLVQAIIQATQQAFIHGSTQGNNHGITPPSTTPPPPTGPGDWLELIGTAKHTDLLPFPDNIKVCLLYAVKGLKCPRSNCRLWHTSHNGLGTFKQAFDSHLALKNQPTPKFKIV